MIQNTWRLLKPCHRIQQKIHIRLLVALKCKITKAMSATECMKFANLNPYYILKVKWAVDRYWTSCEYQSKYRPSPIELIIISLCHHQWFRTAQLLKNYIYDQGIINWNRNGNFCKGAWVSKVIAEAKVDARVEQ